MTDRVTQAEYKDLVSGTRTHSTVREGGEAPTHKVESVVSFTVPGSPVTKPRQTRADKWKQRPCVMRYRAWADKARAAARKATNHRFPGLVLMTSKRMTVIAYFPLPASWTKRTKDTMRGEPHQNKKDADNILKAASDALFPTGDEQIYDMHVMKFWDDGQGPRVEITIS